MRYVELNQVRAGMVERIADYPRSSYRINAQQEKSQLITPHILYQQLGKTEKERKQTCQALFEQCLDLKMRTELRSATNKSWVPGSDSFKAKIEKLLTRRVAAKLRGGDRKSADFREKKKINRV